MTSVRYGSGGVFQKGADYGKKEKHITVVGDDKVLSDSYRYHL